MKKIKKTRKNKGKNEKKKTKGANQDRIFVLYLQIQ